MSRAPAAAHFPSDYVAARAAFRAAAASAGARLSGAALSARSARGDELSIDTAYLGPDAPDAVLVLSSGIHGVEGFAGSAIQHRVLTDLVSAPASGLGLLFLHALNPFGFAELRRVNESNVDLNRNFVAHPDGHEANPGYEALAEAINPPDLAPKTDARSRELMGAYAARHGPARMQEALTRGQYVRPTGVQFGGQKEEESARLLREIAARELRDAARVGWIDFHTGLGPYGEVELISEYPARTGEFTRARAWFGTRTQTTQDGQSVSVPLCGTIERGIEAALPGRELTPVAAEFGTYPSDRVFWAMRAENWVHHHADPESAEARTVRAELLEVFCPADPLWRAGVVETGARLVSRARRGLVSG